MTVMSILIQMDKSTIKYFILNSGGLLSAKCSGLSGNVAELSRALEILNLISTVEQLCIDTVISLLTFTKYCC